MSISCERPAQGGLLLSLRGFLDLLAELSPLRLISIAGPSTLEAIGSLGRVSVARGYANAIGPEFHWHLEVSRVGHVRTRDDIHPRSGRRVLFFELRESAGAEPFVRIYLHREAGEGFGAAREQRFAAVHGHLASGAALVPEGRG